MKKFLTVFTAAALAAGLVLCAGCSGIGYAPNSGGSFDYITGMPDVEYGEGGNYDYETIVEKGFSTVAESPSSYFSLDRNTATYSLVRRQINNDMKISPTSVRIEEMINYFNYSFPTPEEKAVAVTGYLADCPWNPDSKLMLAGIKTADYSLEATNANYVFLIDVSGSMSGDDRLGLAQYGLNKLVDGLTDSDVVSIVTYASGVKTILDGGECTNSGKADIKDKINGLTARGATNGGDGLERAYNIAKKHYIAGGNNRVIIISDGDFNVGATSIDVMKEFIQEKADTGVYLSVLGVGMGNTRDSMLETLATCGNGNYAYLDSELEAEKVLVEELNGTLKTVAKDAKAGVTFTENVIQYRLIGYDSKIISADDFDNEQTDTGEIGSGLCVSALYEIQLAEEADGKLADIEVRYKDVRESEISDSVSCEITVDTPASDDLSFISCVAEFGLILRNSKYRDCASLYSVIQRLTALSAYISGDSYKTELKTLVEKAFESNYYEPVDKPTAFAASDLKTAEIINQSSEFEFDFLAKADGLDFTDCEILAGFGCSVYRNAKYAEDSSVYVDYTVSGAPDVLDSWHLTNIYCTDPKVKFFGGLTLADDGKIKEYLENNGFKIEMISGSNTNFSAKNGRIFVNYVKDAMIVIGYEATNNSNVDF